MVRCYHLVDPSDRAAALASHTASSVPAAASLLRGISRFASTYDGLRSGAIADPRFEAIVERDVDDGVHRNPDVADRPEWFTLAYLHRPDELLDEVRSAGFAGAEIYAVEGVGALMDLNDALDDPVGRATVLRAIGRVEQEPSLLGASPHLMVVAAKPERAEVVSRT